MSKKIVGMVTSYRNITQSDWLWHQTPKPFGVWGNIQLQAQAERPDFLLLYNYNVRSLVVPKKSTSTSLLETLKRRVKGSDRPTPDAQQVLRGVPKEHAIYLMREPPLDEVVKKHKKEYQIADAYCGYISGPDDFAPTPDYMPAIWYHANSFIELDQMPPPEKVRECSWITSGISRTENHRNRLRFLNQLQEKGLPVDFYGRDLPADVKNGGEVRNKWHVMAPYYYNLAIENYADNDWYVSEKLWDSLLAWCLPIYYGGPAADRLLPPGSFLRLPSLDEKGIAYIQDLIATPDTWYAAKDAIAEARQIILHKLNLMNWLSDFVGKLS
jgi:Glycosyltransferase family 10 (fucosyltransferase) C-term